MNDRRTVRILCALLVCGLLCACASKSHHDELPAGQGESPADLYVAMSAEYYKRGQMDAALKRAVHALDEDDDNARAHYMIAIIYQRLGKMELADKHFRTAVEIDPSDPEIRNAWGTFFCNQRKTAEAEQQFSAALKNPLYKTPWVTLTNAGVCALRANNRAKAEENFRRALTANPGFGPALYQMAEMDYNMSRYTSARTFLDRYFQSAPATPAALWLGVRIERKLGNSKRADSYAELLRKRYPDAPEVINLNDS